MGAASISDLQKRIRGLESTRQLTGAMELVAASRLRQGQAKLDASRAYGARLSEAAAELAACRGVSSPYLRFARESRPLYLVIAGDRGLAGGYNYNVLKLARESMAGRDALVLPLGRKAMDRFRSGAHPLSPTVPAADLTAGDCFQLARRLCEGYLGGEFGGIHVVCTEFRSLLSQTPVVRQLLPLVPGPGRGRTADFTRDPEEVLAAVVPQYLGGALYAALCESRCAEQAARRMAMDAANSNAEDLIASLRQLRSRARQAAITREITEIAAGFE